MKKDCINKGYLILDSSYTQAADPNTMRNFGFSRNVIYNIGPISENSSNLTSDRFVN